MTCVKCLNFTHRNYRYLYFGEFIELFDSYKKIYNFETQKCIYKLEESERPVAKLSEL